MDHENAVLCGMCPDGCSTLSTGSKDASKCIKKCGPGFHSSTTMEPCSACPEGTYQQYMGQTNCETCPPGEITPSTNATSADFCGTFDILVNNLEDVTEIASFTTNGSDFLSLVFWCKLQADVSPDVAIHITDTTGHIMTLHIAEVLKIDVGNLYESLVSVSNQKWNLIVCTIDISSQQLQLYTDNTMVLEETNIPTNNSVPPGTVCIAIETSNSNGVYISGLAVYGRSLSAAEMFPLTQSCSATIGDEIMTMDDVKGSLSDTIVAVTPSACDAVDECLNSPCGDHTCINKVDEFMCICHGDMTGDLCDIPPDYCADNACIHGNCVPGTYTCICTEGYTGVFCGIPPVNGGWSEWLEWSACGVTCNGGTRERSRSCNNPEPGYLGNDCGGDSVETETCNTDTCPECTALKRKIGTIVTCSNANADVAVCNLTCTGGSLLPSGQKSFEEYRCGFETTYVWKPTDKLPECVEASKPPVFGFSNTVTYDQDVPTSSQDNLSAKVQENLADIGCLQIAQCEMNIKVSSNKSKKRSTRSSITIEFKIALTDQGELRLGDYLDDGTNMDNPGTSTRKKDLRNKLKPEEVKLPQTQRDVLNLSNSDLNHFLKSLGQPTKGKRSHRLTLLSNVIGLSTTGLSSSTTTESGAFEEIIIQVKALSDGWTNNIRQVPNIQLAQIIRYLLAAHDISLPNNNLVSNKNFEIYTEETLRSYKALRSYNLYESGHVSGLKFHPLDQTSDYCAIKCQSNPSGDTSGTQYQTIVILKRDGEPVGGHCTCVAGLGEACTHLAALLFAVEDFVSRGYKNLPDDEASTEKLCKWVVPRGTKVEPKLLNDVEVRKIIPGKVRKQKMYRAFRFNPINVTKRGVNIENVKALHHRLGLINPNLPWVSSIARPIIKKHTVCNNSDDNKSQECIPILELPDCVGEFDEVLTPAAYITVNSSEEPLTVNEKALVFCSLNQKNEAHDLNENFVKNGLKRMETEKENIEKITRGQADSVQWFKYRRGLITASQYGRVASRMREVKKGNIVKQRGNTSTNPTDNLVTDIIEGSKFQGNKYTKYGLKHERDASCEFERTMKGSHTSFKLHNCGLFVDGFLGASPDRLAECECHGKCVVEIKCPSLSVENLKYLKQSENGELYLVNSHPYYSQVQGQMKLTNCLTCSFVIWYEKKGITVINVSFNPEYWQELFSVMREFYTEFVVPSILTQEQKSLDSHKQIQQTIKNEFVTSSVQTLTGKFYCLKCCKICPEEPKDDNSDASIACECSICDCQSWFHMKCAQVDSEDVDDDYTFICTKCMTDCGM